MNERTTALSITCLSRGHEMKEEQIWDPSPPLPASVCPPVLTQVWDKQQHTHLPNLATGEGVPSQLRGAGVYRVQFPVRLPSPSASHSAKAIGPAGKGSGELSLCVPSGKGAPSTWLWTGRACRLPSPQPPAWASSMGLPPPLGSRQLWLPGQADRRWVPSAPGWQPLTVPPGRDSPPGHVCSDTHEDPPMCHLLVCTSHSTGGLGS